MNSRSNRRPQIVILDELATLLTRRDPGDTERGRTRDSKIAQLEAELADARPARSATAPTDTRKGRP
jgi:hypothetical protein